MTKRSLERQLSPSILDTNLRPLVNFAIAVALGMTGILIAKFLR